MSKTVPSFEFNVREKLATSGLRGLLRLMVGFRARYVIGMLSLAFGLTAKTATYLLIQYFVDNIIGTNGPILAYPLIAAAFVALAGVQGYLTFTSGRLTAQAAEGVFQRLRNFLFDHIQSLSFAYHDATKTGELIQRSTSDVETVRRFYAEQAVGTGRILLLFLVNFAAVLRIDGKLAVFSILVVPILVVVSSLFF